MKIIVAATKDGLIGVNGGIPWHAPGDLKRFREITEGHLVIMGRKTAESLPMGCLPNRDNLVLTRDKTWRSPKVRIVHSVDAALKIAQGYREAYVIGGAEIIRQFQPHSEGTLLTVVYDGPWRDGLDESSGVWIDMPEHLPLVGDGVTHEYMYI